ncbi:FUSC family protein [Flavobacterium sp. MAH-1]|uniref:FUSC family protein n=1 Tax=Flavobacterium agri TaxID=2743471 RepID=A0A7Y9C7B8_9FLAO|nr:FUSC family membrane protein [Flavobacterium agri]NUY81183.1 FUSC family protein [Flavobacterium agri]NYA71207.1 FUSC family protein [Flavobacterium agri]
MVEKIRQLTDTTNFESALKVTVASVLPVIVCSNLGIFDTGFTIALGAFLTYPADIPSNLRHKINGVLVAAFIVAGGTLLINLLHPFPFVLYPITALLLFFLSMISVYGHRANMVSFSGLLAVALAFGHLNSGAQMFAQAGLMLLGGIFYLLVSLAFHFIRPHRYTELQLAECIRLTSKYLKLRGDLWEKEAYRSKIIEKQLNLQVELNAIHENIREVVIRTRFSSGHSNQNRKMLLVFISLVEIMELALSTSFDHNKLHAKFEHHENVLRTYQNLAYNLASVLKKITKSISQNRKYESKHNLLDDLSGFEHAIRNYENELGKLQASEGVFMLTNMLHYAERQIEKIKLIERAFSDGKIETKLLKSRDKDLEKFLAPTYYPWSTFRENLGFSSMIFRHSLRMTATLLIGFLVAAVFQLENVYWILLTIVVIMRPGYGLTKDRSYQRIFGTVVGGIIAFGFLHFVHNSAVIATLTIVSMLLGFMFTSTNYKVGVTFVTMYVVFLYAMITPNVNQVIELRILDTMIGAALSFVANYFLWPSWEFLNVPSHLKKSIEANRDYLNQISLFYNNKGEVTTSYRLARKNAFIETGNLMASFQRMSQEPKSKQKQLPQIYKLAVLNHTLLSASASLGTYIQSHKTSKASTAFNIVAETVVKNLDKAIMLLNLQDIGDHENTPENEDLALRFTELKNIRTRELQEGHLDESEEFRLKMEESQLVIEQLVNLAGLSENVLKSTKRLLLEK